MPILSNDIFFLSFEVKQVYCCVCIIILQEYESAEICVDRILQMEPNNYQAKQLKELIIKKLRRGYYLHMYRSMHACIMSYNVAGIYLVVLFRGYYDNTRAETWKVKLVRTWISV